ncbi:glutamate receptor 2.7-like isoform X2 [Olea europaea var. sylvestris]|uniref:glutamate receptor 2.7-like isoform X2 n=1 Tax=Olea europaea var. sylvestris TaxID=158386 RepID=UPI000C1CFC8C|nr:glutamate receptor 2.7-like isoform X2 [Olea europaea var. sylvestris]
MEKNTLHRKICHLLFFLCIFSAVLNHTIARENNKSSNCQVDHPHRIRRIGSVIDQSSRVGKEQKIAIQMAVNDFNQLSNCSKLALHIKDLHGKSARAASTAVELIKLKKVQGIVAALTLEEATLVTKFEEVANTPIITIGSAAISPSLLLPQPPSVFQLNTDIGTRMQCAAAIIAQFRLQKVTVIYEQSNSFYADSRLTKQLSASLKPYNYDVELDLVFPSLFSLPEPGAFIEGELNKLRSKSSGIFVLVQSSLEFATVLFEKAKKVGIMEKGYVWIVYDDIVNLIESMEQSVIQNMKGIIGIKTNDEEKGKPFQDFSVKFRRKFRSTYPEEEHPYPSMYALRAYDATWAIAKAMEHSKGKINSSGLINHLSSSDFEGLSGKISFKNGKLMQTSTFQIISVTGKIYTEIALSSPELGFSMDLGDQERKGTRRNTNMPKELDLVHWPRGVQTVPKERKVKIGVPVRAAVQEFVSIMYDEEKKITYFGGFSVEVFKAAVNLLRYPFPYDFVPCNGTYDEMLIAVYNKRLDAVVADMTILDDRYDYADFSQPYMDCEIVMVVPAKKDLRSSIFIVVTAFEWKLWVVMAALSLSTGAIIFLNEHANDNPEFGGSFPQIIGSMLWFSVTLLSFAQRESIKNNLSRFVLTVWLFVIMIVTASYTAVLSSMMTVPRLQPSIVEVDYLQKTNAIVGCNEEGFIPRYLTDTLKFKEENLKKIGSLSDYKEAFEKKQIAAAFFISPHAKLFLANNSKRFVIAKPSLQVGGLAYVFPKGSSLNADISRAILNMKQRGEINHLEERFLFFSDSSSSDQHMDDLSLYLSHFSGPLIVSSVTTAIVFLIIVVRVIRKRWSIHDSIQSSLMYRRISRWAAFLLVECHARFYPGYFGASIIQRQNNLTNIVSEK